jgi:hypothetical protein
VASTTLSGNFYLTAPTVAATLDTQATVIFGQPFDQGQRAGLGWRLLVSDGT